MATSPTEKSLVNIAIRLILLLTTLGFAGLCDHVLKAPETVSTADFMNAYANDAIAL